MVNYLVVFFISGYTLKLEELKTVLQYKVPIMYALLAINFITTLLGFGFVKFPLLINQFRIGITIFASVPTTLGVGVALTLQSKGDTVLALLLTVVSNLLGIVTIPVMLGGFFTNGGSIVIDQVTLAYKLSITVLVPISAGILSRYFISGSANFTKTYKIELGLFSTCNLAILVWMSLSNARDSLFKQEYQQILLVIAISIAMHTFYLFFNGFMVSKYSLNVPLKQAIAVVIMASQKSSPVALAVISNLTSAPGDKGLYAVPCIVGQLIQIYMDSAVAARLKKFLDETEASESRNYSKLQNDIKSNEIELAMPTEHLQATK